MDLISDARSRTCDRRGGGSDAPIAAFRTKIRQFITSYQTDHVARTMIYALFSVNFLLILAYIAFKVMIYLDPTRHAVYYYFLITSDHGYPELFNYMQLAVAAWLLFQVFVRTRQAIYVSLSMIFLLALGEDALRLHEQVGTYALIIDLPAPSFLGAQHFGELLEWFVVGALSVGALVYGFSVSAAEDRKIGIIFVIILVILGFLAALVDALQIVLSERIFGLDFLLELIEDGGEMLMIALALSVTLLLARHPDDLRRPSPCR
jgi:hypothetical protein